MRLLLLICLLLFVIAPGAAQVMVVQTDTAELHYSYDQIRQLRFAQGESRRNAALNVHTPAGIRQLRLARFDSLTIAADSLLWVWQDTGRCAILLSDIDRLSFSPIFLPDRIAGAQTGSEFMNAVKDLETSSRESRVRSQILKGNLPDFFRQPVTLSSQFKDANQEWHTVEYDVMPDYLAIGSNDNWCRIPMGPKVAQAIADSFHCSLPTTKLVDDIWRHAPLKLEPIPYPWSLESTKVSRFVQHNRDIDAQRNALGGLPGELIAGIKKDVVICNALRTTPGYVAIYGWHYPGGSPIQPLYLGHGDSYMDYSHGIRLIGRIMRVDGVEMSIPEILADPVLYRLISDESGVMTQPYYPY